MWVPPCTQVTEKLASWSGKGCVSPTLPYQDLRCQVQAGMVPLCWTQGADGSFFRHTSLKVALKRTKEEITSLA